MKKPIIKIVRIEHPFDKCGFWCSVNKQGVDRCETHSEYEKIYAKHKNMNEWPNYSRDEELKTQISDMELQNYKFAFINIFQLQKAFSSSQLKECIDKLGFKIYLLSVNDYYQSSFQVVFRNPLEKEDISSLFV